jgi:hypothetical protein
MSVSGTSTGDGPLPSAAGSLVSESGSPSGGPPTVPTVTTPSCSPPPSTRPTSEDCSLHLDRGYGSAAVRARCGHSGIDDVVCAKQRKEGSRRGVVKMPRAVPLGLRWPVERTNSWLSNFGQMRRNTDRKVAHRLTQLALAITLIITVKLIDWRYRWSPA